jgi:aminoglycoside phosphotransferase (APT) family kinase protein
MAVENRLDPRAVAAALRPWLAARVPDARNVQVTDVRLPDTSGWSYLSILGTASWSDRSGAHRRDLVVRLQPPSGGIFPSYDLPCEFAVMAALAETGIPLPEMLWVETDPGVLGAPFLVMSRVSGRVPPDDPPYSHAGWVLELGEEGQRRLYDNGLRVLAGIAALDPGALDVSWPTGLSKHSPGLDDQLAYYRHLYEWSFPDGGHACVEAALKWADEHRPAETGPDRVSWGDARIGNMIFADDLSVAAVLDWELTTLARPEQDLGWWRFTLRMYGEGVGAAQPPGFPGPAETVERYEELSGHRVRDLDYYEAFAALRAAIIIGRVGTMMITAGQLPPDSPMPISNPAANILAELLDLPAPADTMADWLGKR